VCVTQAGSKKPIVITVYSFVWSRNTYIRWLSLSAQCGRQWSPRRPRALTRQWVELRVQQSKHMNMCQLQLIVFFRRCRTVALRCGQCRRVQ